jgi:hypothetical protein
MQTHRFRELDVGVTAPAPIAVPAMMSPAFMPFPIALWPVHQPQIAEVYRVAYEFAQAQVAREVRIRRLAFSVN